MYSFQINSFGAAVLLSTLFMGVLGAFVVAPIACIELTWNFAAKHFWYMPIINPWQAILVYLAFATVVYLFGWIRIEIKADGWE